MCTFTTGVRTSAYTQLGEIRGKYGPVCGDVKALNVSAAGDGRQTRTCRLRRRRVQASRGRCALCARHSLVLRHARKGASRPALAPRAHTIAWGQL